MYINHYDVELHDDNNAAITVGLRLPIGAQAELRKKYKMETRNLLFAASTDDDMLLSLFDKCLNWSGNSNAVKSGEELYERMVDEGIMGVIERQRIVINIGAASGIFSEDEKVQLLKKVDAAAIEMFQGGDGASVEVEPTAEKKA